MNRAFDYRKRDDVISAIEVTSTNIRAVAMWCGGRVVEESTNEKKELSIVVPTLDGNKRARYGDWIAKGHNGVIEQFNGDYFNAEYVRA